MARLRIPLLVTLFLVAAIVTAWAGIETDKGDREMLKVADPNSTFEIDEVPWIIPLDTVEVAVYMDSDSLMGFIQNRIWWDSSELVLIDAWAGPGVPDTASFTDSIYTGADTINYTIYNAEEFQVSAGEPIAYLKFEVQCFGYSSKAFIRFADGDDANFYNHDNQPYSPVRDEGWVMTVSEGIYTSISYPDYVYAYPGQQVVPMEVYFSQSLPGRLTELWLTYDTTVVHCDSVIAGPGLNGGTMNVSTSYDTIKLEFPGTNPLMVTNQEVVVLTLYFGMETADDDYITYVGMPYVTRVTECGDVTVPYHTGNSINVPDHTAEADLGEVSYYTSATTYDVPVVMDSNAPINDYELYVQFPAGDISYEEVVGVAGFAAPVASVDAGDTTIIQINSGLYTEYDPEDLPATVFKLRFSRLHAVSVGDTFHVTFSTAGDNEVLYEMDSLFGDHEAFLTLEDGFIRIKSNPPPTCPALSIWNGESYELENTILAACDGADIREDITEYYRIRKPVVPVDGQLLFRLSEEGEQFSRLKGLEIIAIDHEVDRPVHVTDDGTVMTVGKPFAIKWARDHRGADITELIATRDEVPYESFESGYIDVSFGALSEDQVSNFVATSQDPIKEIDRDLLTASADDLESRDKKLRVYVQGARGDWNFIGEEDARRNPGLQATSVASEYIEAGREFVLRYAWDELYSIDVVELRSAEKFEGRIHDVALREAIHSGEGCVTGKLGSAESPGHATLSPGQAIELSFDVSALPPMKVGTVREYVFVTTGYYTDVNEMDDDTPELEFSLGSNYPNPFNPNTVIRYSLKHATDVNLAVYDVRGALVRTLVRGSQDAGRYSAGWDGLNERGNRVSSGVYFYRIKTQEFTETRKMILLR